MKRYPGYRPEPPWVPVVRQLAGVVTVAAVAVAAAVIAMSWSLGRKPQPVILGPDSTAALYPVCAPDGALLWFPQRHVPRQPVAR